MAQDKQRQLRHRRIRAKVSGTAKKPRLNVFRSLNNIYVQLIDDEHGKTLVSASSKEVAKKAKKSEIAAEVGKLIGQKAAGAGISEVAFDRGGFSFHGRIKSLAEAAREAGLKF
ncbi:MAG: 50S ribosomal protein L18 [Candidatus Doudnabacteria bacterium]|nr:50S ribosomal protein L18 [Candidatus Doudnabacteria bacterium]